MKIYVLSLISFFLCFGCNAQENKNEKETQENKLETPKGTWKVDKEFDENGNLIKYDSVYSWSSNHQFNNEISDLNKDILITSFKSKFFSNFSQFKNDDFPDVFSKDSLFSNHFFNHDFFGSSFGKDFMNIDKIRQQMLTEQKEFLEKYQSEFRKREDKN